MIDNDLRDLYQEVILDHGRNPRHFGKLAESNHSAHGHNPLCGDQVHLQLMLDDKNKISDIAFEGKGCAISMASASMMTELVLGKTVSEAHALMEAFVHLTKGEEINHVDVLEDDLDRLAVMSGVSQFPMRVKCATLAWHTLDAACKGEEDVVSE